MEKPKQKKTLAILLLRSVWISSAYLEARATSTLSTLLGVLWVLGALGPVGSNKLELFL